MKKASSGRDQLVVADDEAPKVPEPGERPLPDPPPSIAPQLPPILMGGPRVVPPSRDDRLDASAGQPRPQGVAVIPPSGDPAFGALAGAPRLPWTPDRDGLEGLLKARDRRRGSRLQVCSHRRTRAIDHHH